MNRLERLMWAAAFCLVAFFGVDARAQTATQDSGGTYNFGHYYTYSVVAPDVATAASATDVVCISGSATRTVVLKKILLAGSTTNATTVSTHVNIVKRSTANTGGTSTTPAIVPHDSQNAAATAVVRAYTANPTTGTLVGNIAGMQMIFAVTADWPATLYINFGENGMQGIILRGTSESACVNLNGATVTTSGALDASFEWIEQ